MRHGREVRTQTTAATRELTRAVGELGFRGALISGRTQERFLDDPSSGRSSTQLSVAEYFQRNFHITTSGIFSDPPLRCAIDTFGAEKILFAVDHPFSDGAIARRWLEQAAITDEEREQIAHGNAQRLLGL